MPVKQWELIMSPSPNIYVNGPTGRQDAPRAVARCEVGTAIVSNMRPA